MTPEEKKLLAEAEKAEIESLEIKQRLGWKNTGLSWGMILKYSVAGIVAGILLYFTASGFIEDRWDALVTEKEELTEKAETLEIEKAELAGKAKTLEMEKVELSNKTKTLENDKKVLQDERERLVAQIGELQQEIAADTQASTGEPDQKIVSSFHRLEEQRSRINPLTDNLDIDVVPISPAITQWVYLGEFEGGRWIKSYFNFPKTTLPENLQGGVFTLTANALNIRNKKYSGKIIGVLDRGDSVVFHKVEAYFSTGYIWARINQGV